MTVLGAILPPEQPPERLREVATAADRAGLEQLWLWEDCFQYGGIAAMTAALSWTESLTVGIGLLPVPLRNVAVTAMEIAMLGRLFPGRVVAGIGHGVLDWMAQVGARSDSPMARLAEYTDALAALLRGETVTTFGAYVQLDGVRLDWPPAVVPPLLVGAVKPKTTALAGERADGVILDEGEPEKVSAAMTHFTAGRAAAGRRSGGDVVVYVRVEGRPEAARVAAQIAPVVAAGATHVVLQSTGDGPDLKDFVAFVARDVRPLVP